MRALLALTAVTVLAWGGVPARADDPPAPAPGEKPPQEKPAERGYLGFQPAAIPLLSPEAREGLRVTTLFSGVVVLVVTPNAPAEKAGLQRGDLLLKFAGKDVPDTKAISRTDTNAERHFADDFKKVAEGIKPGDTVEFVVDRRGKEMVIKATAVDRATIEKIDRENKEAGKPKPAEPTPGPAPSDRGYIGFEARNVDSLNPKEKKRWKVTAAKGIVALHVVPGSPGEKAGLKNGDVLVKFGGVPLPTAKELEEAKSARDLVQETFAKIAASFKAGKEVEIVVEREGAPVTLKAVAVDGPAMQKLRAAVDDDDDDEEGEEGEKHEKHEGGEKSPGK